MRNSLSSRLTYRIMAVVLVMMVIIAGVVYFSVREYMLEEAKERYYGILLKSHEEIRRRLSDVSVATTNNVHDIGRDIDNPDKMFGHMKRIVTQNKSIVCSTLLFEKGYYPSKGSVFIPCARKESAENVRVTRIDSTYNSNFYGEWLQEQLKLDKTGWTEAYFESKEFAGGQKPRQLTTFFVPIHNHEGRPVALLCTDLPLEIVRQGIVEDMDAVHKKFENGSRYHSYNFVIDQKGTYIIHPDKHFMVKENYAERAKNSSDTLDDRIVASMMKGEKGSAMIDDNGVPSWIYYRTVKRMGWIIAIVVPKDVITRNGRTLNTIILLIMLLALAALYFISRHQIRKTTNPLHQFAQSADEMALGNFSSPLPEVKGYDEVRQLHDAFANMQTSLSIYVDELKKTTMQKASLESELKIANAIQMSMLPKVSNSPCSGEIDLFASLTPALEVGGDLYDYFLCDKRIYFCIGDVSGKGVPAALMMAVVRAMFRSEARRSNNAATIVSTMNRNLSEEYTADYFVTMFVGILDLTSGHLDYCNAGHETPVISGQALPVKLNLPIGALADWNYEGQETKLHPGDMLFLFTDGLSEAKNTVGKQLGRKHVKQLAWEHCNYTAQQLVELMESEVLNHSGDAEQSDDITMLAIKWLPNSIHMKASMDEISCLEPFVVLAASKAGLEDKEAKRLRLAVEESVANIINHGQANDISLQAIIEDNQLVLIIDDDGKPFNPTLDSPTDFSKSADERPPGGLGIMFLHNMADGLDYQRINEHNILRIKKVKK